MKLLNLMVDSGTKLVMGISAIAVLVVTFAQVLFRYVLKSPLPWSQDVLRLAFTYLVFWGAAWCVREKRTPERRCGAHRHPCQAQGGGGVGH